MKKSDKIFILFMAFTILLAVAGWAFLQYVMPDYVFSAYWYIPAYFTLFYFITFGVFMKPASNAKKFTNKFLSFVVIKQLTSLSLLLVLLFAYRAEVVNICAVFLIYYFILIIPETLYNIYLKKNTTEENHNLE